MSSKVITVITNINNNFKSIFNEMQIEVFIVVSDIFNKKIIFVKKIRILNSVF